MSTSESPAGSDQPLATSPPGITRRRTQIVLSLAVAVAIVATAWAVGGRQGFDQIGMGGVNQDLLPKVGEVAPDFTVHDLNGRPVALSEFRGQPVWLNFWGSWCAPCRSEMPEIQQAYETLAPDGLVLLAVSMRESPEEAAAFASRNNVTFTILTDQYEQATGEHYPIVNFPTHILIDRDGKVHAVVLAELDAEAAIAHGRELIAAG